MNATRPAEAGAVDRVMSAHCQRRVKAAIASWRRAQALLDEGASRSLVAVPLRSAHRFVVEVGATPLQHQVESLASDSFDPIEVHAADRAEHARLQTGVRQDQLAGEVTSASPSGVPSPTSTSCTGSRTGEVHRAAAVLSRLQIAVIRPRLS
jgi:hypothetical protein